MIIVVYIVSSIEAKWMWIKKLEFAQQALSSIECAGWGATLRWSVSDNSGEIDVTCTIVCWELRPGLGHQIRKIKPI